MLIERLLQIKEFRESRAQQEVRRASGVLADAERALGDARQRLRDHQAGCLRRECEIYAQLCTRVVQLKDLSEAQHQVERFKQSIKDHEAQEDQARKHRLAMAHCLEQAKKLLAAAISAREKFTQLHELNAAELRIEQTRAEDAELEEVPVKPSSVTEELAA